jgi:hypothetical protein
VTLTVFWLALAGISADNAESYCSTEVAIEELPDILDAMYEGLDEVLSEPESRWEVLPHGDLSGEDLIAILERWQQEAPSFQEILGSLADGHSRRISAESLEDAVALAGFLLPDFVPIEEVEEIVIEDGLLTVRFKDDLKIKQDAQEVWLLQNADDDDPFLLDEGNPPVLHETSSYTLNIASELQFEFSAEGLKGVRDGDLVGSKFIFSRSIQLSSVHGDPGLQRLDGGLVLAVDASGEPVVENGRYVGVESEEWLAVDVAGDVTRLPIPRFGE